MLVTAREADEERDAESGKPESGEDCYRADVEGVFVGDS